MRMRRVFGAALADARDADVGFDRNQHVALVEKTVEVGRFVDADAGDLGFRQRAFGGQANQTGGRRGG